MTDSFFDSLKGKLIVSCQALDYEPLFSSAIMARMAVAAKEGGAVAIRANTVVDIQAIKEATGLPVVGLIKRDYADSDIYITATRKEVDELMEAGVDLVALDATRRARPNGETLEELVAHMKQRGQKIMADISTLEEALYAESIGIDCVSTTLSGYTPHSRQEKGPDYDLVQQASAQLSIPVIAEGKIESPEQAARMLELGAHAVVVGSAITRPQLITARYAKEMEKVQL